MRKKEQKVHNARHYVQKKTRQTLKEESMKIIKNSESDQKKISRIPTKQILQKSKFVTDTQMSRTRGKPQQMRTDGLLCKSMLKQRFSNNRIVKETEQIEEETEEPNETSNMSDGSIHHIKEMKNN